MGVPLLPSLSITSHIHHSSFPSPPSCTLNGRPGTQPKHIPEPPGAGPPKTTNSCLRILFLREALSSLCQEAHLLSCPNLLSFPGASGLCALLHLFPGHKIQRPDSGAAAWRVRESRACSSPISPTQHFPLTQLTPPCFLCLPHILLRTNPSLPWIPLSPDSPNLTSLTWLSCPGFWLTRCPSRWLPLLCPPPWPPSMQTSIATLLTPTRCDSD